MAAPTTIFQGIGLVIDGWASSFYAAAASSLSSNIAGLAIAGITMTIAVYGSLVLAGKIDDSFSDFLVKSVKWILVAAVALNAGNYLTYVAGSVQSIEDGLTESMGVTGGNIYQQLDGAIDKANELIEQLNEEAQSLGITEVGRAIAIALCICIIGFGTILFLCLAGAMVITTKFALAAMFAIGPIFVLGLMWPATAGFFDRWLGQTLTFVLTIVFISLIIGLGVSVFTAAVEYTRGQMAAEDGGNYWALALSLLLLCGVFAYLSLESKSWASSLAGGAAAAAIGLRQAIAPTSGLRGALGGYGGGGSNLRAAQYRLDPRTGTQTPAGRAEHYLAGRSVFSPNPAYRRALVDRFRDSMNMKNSVSRQ